MSESEDNKYAASCKKLWLLYSLATFAVIVLLVTLVAQDNEERLFYSLMTAAAAYVFRPGERTVDKYVLKLFGVAPPAKTDEEK